VPAGGMIALGTGNNLPEEQRPVTWPAELQVWNLITVPNILFSSRFGYAVTDGLFCRHWQYQQAENGAGFCPVKLTMLPIGEVAVAFE